MIADAHSVDGEPDPTASLLSPLNDAMAAGAAHTSVISPRSSSSTSSITKRVTFVTVTMPSSSVVVSIDVLLDVAASMYEVMASGVEGSDTLPSTTSPRYDSNVAEGGDATVPLAMPSKKDDTAASVEDDDDDDDPMESASA